MWAKCKGCGKYSHITKSVCSRCEMDHKWNKKIKEMEKAAEKERRENPTIEAEEPFLNKKCQSCQRNAGIEDHTCPYKADINDDMESMCNCCDECIDQCCMDI